MLRLLILTLVALVPLLGCSPSAPRPTAEKPPTQKLPPMLEYVAYGRDNKNEHGFLCRPAGEGPFPAVLLIHDRKGQTDNIKDQTFRLAKDGFVVLAVDLYRGQAAKTAQDAERLERQLTKDRALRDIQAAVDYLSDRRDVRAADVGVIGLGMGGTYALEAALHDPRLHALVLCYSPLPTDAKQLAPLKTSVFCILAGKDKSVPSEDIMRFCQAMRKAGKRVESIRVYGTCDRGFLDPANWPASGKTAESDVEEAWKLIAGYLERTLM